MKIAITGATGFIGRYVLDRLLASGHELRCWSRAGSDRTGIADLPGCEWVPGELNGLGAAERLVVGCAGLVHLALWRPGRGFMGAEGESAVEFVERNVMGTLRLIEAARAAGVGRFVLVSTCAVHDRILADRPLDEAHPAWPASHYGAHKAALEAFVHSFGWGQGYAICALRPTGVYGVAQRVEESKWYPVVRAVAAGEPVHCQRGGKEVHAADVARAIELLLSAPAEAIAGEAFNCYDRYVSEWDVAQLAREIAGKLKVGDSRSEDGTGLAERILHPAGAAGGASVISGRQTSPKNEIVTAKLRKLGMTFGGEPLLRATVEELVRRARG